MGSKKRDLQKYWRDFKELIQKNDNQTYHPFFFDYCRHLTDKQVFDKYVANLTYLFQLAQKPIEGITVLDVGCGFGVDCFILSSLGAKEAHGIDFNDSWIQTINKYLSDLKWDLPIYAKQGDASNLPYNDNSFDVLISVEAISHYHDADNFLTESYRVLKPGGVLIISDANNGSNPLIKRETFEVWERFEKGPTSENFHGHPIRKTFLDMRKEIIVKNFPQLTKEEVDKLAENTFGFSKEQIKNACKEYIETKKMPSSKFEKGKPAFNPEMNDYIERLFSPKELANKLNDIGFEAKMFAHFGGAGAKNLISAANAILRAFTPVTIYFARGYKIVAVKK